MQWSLSTIFECIVSLALFSIVVGILGIIYFSARKTFSGVCLKKSEMHHFKRYSKFIEVISMVSFLRYFVRIWRGKGA
jgi:hypothetical protein